jgi:hypothetical protein
VFSCFVSGGRSGRALASGNLSIRLVEEKELSGYPGEVPSFLPSRSGIIIEE